MATIKSCPDCNQLLTEQRWERGSDNKKFHAWRHEVKSDCKYIEWINEPKQDYKAKSTKYSPKPSQQEASQMVAMRELYVLIKAVGLSLLSVQSIPPDEAEKLINDNVMYLKREKK